MMQTVVLQEFEQRDLDLDHHAAATLRNIAGRALLVLPTDHPGRWSIRSSSLVGTVVTPTLRLLIRPKVSDANLFHLLGAAGDRLKLGSEVFEYQRSNDLVPAFATFFARDLEPHGRADGPSGLPLRRAQRRPPAQPDRCVRHRLDAAGSSGASTFTIDMNRLFEQFVEDRLRRYLRGKLDVVGQAAVSLDHGRHVRIDPISSSAKPAGRRTSVIASTS